MPTLPQMSPGSPRGASLQQTGHRGRHNVYTPDAGSEGSRIHRPQPLLVEMQKQTRGGPPTLARSRSSAAPPSPSPLQPCFQRPFSALRQTLTI